MQVSHRFGLQLSKICPLAVTVRDKKDVARSLSASNLLSILDTKSIDSWVVNAAGSLTHTVSRIKRDHETNDVSAAEDPSRGDVLLTIRFISMP